MRGMAAQQEREKEEGRERRRAEGRKTEGAEGRQMFNSVKMATIGGCQNRKGGILKKKDNKICKMDKGVGAKEVYTGISYFSFGCVQNSISL